MLKKYLHYLLGLFIVVEIIVLCFSSNNFLLHFLFVSGTGVYKRFYPTFWWLVWPAVKLHLPLLIVLFFSFKQRVAALWQKAMQVAEPFLLATRQPLTGLARTAEIRWLWLMLLVALAARLVYMLYTDNCMETDAYARLYISYQWCHTPAFLASEDWESLPFYLIGGGMYLTDDVIWVPRIISVVFGVLSVVPFYYLVRRIFGKFNALVSSLVFVLWPVHIKLSTLTMSEAPFLFFLLVAIWAFFSYIDKKEKRDVYLVALVIGVSGASYIRMEGWLFAALFTPLLFFARAPFSRVLAYSIAGAIVPASILYATWLATGDALKSLTFSDYEVHLFMLQHNMNFYKNIMHLPEAFAPLWYILIPLGVVLSIGRRHWLNYLLLFIPTAFLLQKIFALTLIGQPRYLLDTAVMCIPFYVAAVIFLAGHLPLPRFWRNGITVLLLLLSLVPGAIQHITTPVVTGNGRLDKGFVESARWAKNNLPPGSGLYIDNNNFSAWAWMVYSGTVIWGNTLDKDLGPEKLKHFYPRLIAEDYVGTRPWEIDTFFAGGLTGQLAKGKIDYLVFFKGGPLSNALQFKAPVEIWQGYTFKKLVDYSGYSIYTVSKKPEED